MINQIHMISSKWLLAAFILFSFSSYGQNDFREGYIISWDQDTTYGFIDYRGNRMNSERCFFKNTLDDTRSEYGPNDIKAYRFLDSRYYVSKKVETIDGSRIIFIEFLIDGIVDVYYYYDQSGEHYLIDSDGTLRPLKNEEKEVYQYYNTYKKESKEYVGMLKYAFNQSPVIMQKAELAQLNHNSLIKLANQYHTEVCADDACIIYEKKLPKFKLNFGPLVGLQNVWITSTSNSFPVEREYLNGNVYSSKPSVLAGVFLRVNLPHLDERVNLQYEVSVQSWNVSDLNVQYSEIYNIDRRNEVTFQSQSISNVLMGRFHFPSKRFRPVMALGGFIDYIYNEDNYRKQSMYNHDGGPYEGGISFYPEGKFDLKSSEKKWNYGMVVSSGLLHLTEWNREIHFDLRYQMGFNNYGKMTSHQVIMSLGFGILKSE